MEPEHLFLDFLSVLPSVSELLLSYLTADLLVFSSVKALLSINAHQLLKWLDDEIELDLLTLIMMATFLTVTNVIVCLKQWIDSIQMFRNNTGLWSTAGIWLREIKCERALVTTQVSDHS